MTTQATGLPTWDERRSVRLIARSLLALTKPRII